MPEPIEMQVNPSVYARLLHAMFVGPPLAPKTEEEARWDDDGGPPFPDGCTHTIGPAPS